jgi:pimeloyl-ACP methyl ester carboxylesterase
VNYFIETVIKRPTILVGNSLGGFIIMNSVSSSLSKNIVGTVLINPLILSKNKNTIPMDNNWSYSKFFVKSYFYYLKNKSIIHFFLNKLYPVFPKKIDDYLLNSIYYSACKKNASEVFYKILLENIVKPTVFIENILPNMDVPMLFIYGEKDEWIDPKNTMEQMKNYSKIEFVSVNAGHCPHDEIPEIINEKILNFTRKLGF